MRFPPSSYSEVVQTLRRSGSVFAEDEARLLLDAAAHQDALDAMVDQRVRGLPIEQILGWVEFARLRIAVVPGVFVPRRRTELLVEQAASLAPPRAVVVELCCGAAAVAAALLHLLDGADVHASDIDARAVACARRNVGDDAQVYQGDLYAALPTSLRGRIDVLVANAPYVPTNAIELMPPEARLYEPRLALDGGADGLDVQLRIIADAAGWLAPGGHLLIETSQAQASHTSTAMVSAGLRPWTIRSEDLDATATIGRRGAASKPQVRE